MFKLSSGFKSGLRTLALLTERAEPRIPVPISEMGPVLGLSEKYLEQLLMSLRRAGLVRSTRGINGGFTLAKDPAQISLLDVLHALQGPTEFCDCGTPDCQDCVRPEVWNTLQKSFEGTLASITLQHLASDEPFALEPRAVVLPEAPFWQGGSGI